MQRQYVIKTVTNARYELVDKDAQHMTIFGLDTIMFKTPDCKLFIPVDKIVEIKVRESEDLSGKQL